MAVREMEDDPVELEQLVVLPALRPEPAPDTGAVLFLHLPEPYRFLVLRDPHVPQLDDPGYLHGAGSDLGEDEALFEEEKSVGVDLVLPGPHFHLQITVF